jgi:diphthine synthase|tara:strand:- start:11410 stop:12126 length:717 start_codon:yes stop_codon:yes gene_type:complete
MLYLIGLGLNVNGISKEGLEITSRCKKIYLDEYTVDLPYSPNELVEVIGKTIEFADRDFVEGLSIVDEAKKKDVALLVYGSPLTATTHITLIEEANAAGIKHKVIHGASIIDGVADTGLQLYKFGKIASMPAWKESFTPTSFMEVVKENQSINAHSLILIDIGLDFQDALEQLEESAKSEKVKLGKVVVCQRLGTRNSKFFYKEISELKEFTGVRKPYSIIIPGKLHFVEKNILEGFQ